MAKRMDLRLLALRLLVMPGKLAPSLHKMLLNPEVEVCQQLANSGVTTARSCSCTQSGYPSSHGFSSLVCLQYMRTARVQGNLFILARLLR
jgi:hypothetical protein